MWSIFVSMFKTQNESQNELGSDPFASIFWKWLWRLVLFYWDIWWNSMMKTSRPVTLFFQKLLIIDQISLISIVLSSYLFLPVWVLLVCVFQGIGSFHLNDKICGHTVIYNIPLNVCGLSSYDFFFISDMGNFSSFSFWLAWLVFYELYMSFQRTSFCAFSYF